MKRESLHHSWFYDSVMLCSFCYDGLRLFFFAVATPRYSIYSSLLGKQCTVVCAISVFQVDTYAIMYNHFYISIRVV